MATITDGDLDRAAEVWNEDGWVLIDSLVDQATMEKVADEVRTLDVPEEIGPTRRADVEERPRFRAAQFDGTHLFPLPGAPTLNQLVVHPGVVDFARRALGQDDLRLYQSRLWSKHGGHTDYEQPLHRDLNHSLVPLRHGSAWGHLECFLYLGPVDEANGAPMLVPRSATERAGLEEPTARVPVERDDRPDLYALEVAARGGPGSLLAYRSDVWHRGTSIAPDRERHVLVIAYRAAAAEWIGFDAHAPLVNRSEFLQFVSRCEPEQLALFGFPLPGHPFWSPSAVDELATMYPDLDVTPWRRALPDG